MEDKIREYFGDGAKFGLTITYVKQSRLGGTADAALVAQPYVDGDFVYFTRICCSALMQLRKQLSSTNEAKRLRLWMLSKLINLKITE